MNILHIIQDLNIYGGTPKKILDLGKHSKNNHHIYTWHKVFDDLQTEKIITNFKDNGIKIHQNYIGKNVIKHFYALVTIIKNNEINIIQSYFYFGEFLGYLIKLRFPKIKFIVSFVGSNNPVGITNFFLNQVYKRVDIISYNSEYTKKEKLKCHNILKNKKSFIIYNGINFKFNSRTNNFNSKSTINLLSIGGLTDIKNHIVIIKMIKILKEKTNKNIKLTIAGDGPLYIRLGKYILNHGLSDNVKLLGYVDNIDSLLESCDFYLHPCICEGFGISVIEAMSYQKCILASNAGALPELIEHNDSGFLIDPHDSTKWAGSILKVIDNPKEYEIISKKAYNRGKILFNLGKFVDNHDKKLYNIK